MNIINLEALRAAPVYRDPCDYLVVPEFVRREALALVNHDYPEIEVAGNFPPEELTCGATFTALLDELREPALKGLFAEKFGVDLDDHPLQLTVRKFSEATDGNVHNDSKTKIVTVLIYFNEDWPHAGGRLRLLRSPKDIDDYAVEVSPTAGTLLAFRRSKTSFHGFQSCGDVERRSLQMYWVAPKREQRDLKDRGSLRKRLKRWLRGRD